MQKARRHPWLRESATAQKRGAQTEFALCAPRSRALPQRDGLRPLVGMWFQVHYPPLVGVLPIFRSRYLVRYRSPAST